MAKSCNAIVHRYGTDVSCGHNVFSHGYCRAHQYLRTDDKYKKVKTKPFKKISGEKSLFDAIWSEKKIHQSELSGRDLEWVLEQEDISWYLSCFAHVLSKKQYPALRLDKDNIILIHPEEHSMIDAGTEEKRIEYGKKWNCNFAYFEERKKQLIDKYKLI